MPQRTVMVVEDDPDIMHLLTHILVEAGYHVVRAYGGEDALRKVKQVCPDLILTDLAMPRMSGVEIIHQIKKDRDTQHIPIVAVTAFMWDGIAQSAGQVGVDGFIAKPFTPKQLLGEVVKYLPRG